MMSANYTFNMLTVENNTVMGNVVITVVTPVITAEMGGIPR